MENQSPLKKFEEKNDRLRKKYISSFARVTITFILIVVASWLASQGWEYVYPTTVPAEVTNAEAYLKLTHLVDFIVLLSIMTAIYAIHIIVGLVKYYLYSKRDKELMVKEMLENVKNDNNEETRS